MGEANPIQVRAFGVSDPGGRTYNEDYVLIDAGLDLFLVADGVGGHAAGEVASRMAAMSVQEQTGRFLMDFASGEDPHSIEARSRWLDAIPRFLSQASEAVFEDSRRNPEHRGMATTTVLLKRLGAYGIVAHVGDSRLYLYRGDTLYQLTEDHTLVRQLLQRGSLRPDEVATFPHRHALVKAVGIFPSVAADSFPVEFLPGDRYLLCTDGVHDVLTEQELKHLLATATDEVSAARLVVETAKRKATRDNATALVVWVEGTVETCDTEEMEMTIDTKASVVRDIFLFRDLSFQEIVRVLSIVEEVRVSEGTTVFRRMDRGDDFYIVAEGQVAVTRRGTRLTTIGPGGHFGELSLFCQPVRSATVTATEASRLLRIARRPFMDLLRSDPDLSRKLLWALLVNTGDRVRDLSRDLVAALESRNT